MSMSTEAPDVHDAGVPAQGKTPPRGPKGHPILGVIPELRADTLGFLTHVAKTYGDFVPLKVFMSTAYLLNHPKHIEHVLQTNYRNYRKTKMMDKFKPILGEGLFISEDELWTRQRKLVQPSFHRQRITAMAGTMIEALKEHVATWDKFAASGEEFNLSLDMSYIALEVALRTMFGNSLPREEANAISDALHVANEITAKRIWEMTRISEYLPTRENRAYREAAGTLDSIVNRIIRDRRAEGARKDGAVGTSQDDLLGVLIDARDADTDEGMSDKQLRDEVLTLLLSGHETTAVMLGWAFLMLSQRPEILERMRDEADLALAGRDPVGEDIRNLDYTKRVVQEVARLKPPIWWVARTAISDDTICGENIKAGTTVLISQFLVHRNPSVWEDPERFDPDRFEAERVVNRSKFAYLPFGAGPRVCVASAFATMEMQFLLAMMLRRFDVQITSSLDPEMSNLITLRPKYDIMARVTPRRRH
ncbi:MAG: cytochrome P450 [Rhodospirillaceae bacterium]|nr:cytochrome P450 [Rhodospirillaceae bacterium]